MYQKNFTESNDQKLRYCFKCKVNVRSKTYKCSIVNWFEDLNYDISNDDLCEFEFSLCKMHKGMRNKIFKKHVEEEHYSIEIV